MHNRRSTAYQDSPGAGVKSSKLALDTGNVAPVATRATATTTTTRSTPDAGDQQSLRAVTSQQQILNTQTRAESAVMRAEMNAVRRRAQGLPPDAQTKVMMQVHDKWWPGIQAKEA